MCEYCDCRGLEDSEFFGGLDTARESNIFGEFELCLDLDKHPDGRIFICADFGGSGDVVSVKKEIQYCPFCGRKL